ncbi:hypothetical protein AVEN_211397-1 [Araneus ventricosus]|uniref:Uncharacterized protein n=1 Tax=Araneus ventricosus TaxID=182803 RepID=A0A4Y2MYP8_ARAVE|nr:hypothetical protein AVEN_211397-1 [Araneus ventricosus]
MNDRLTEYSTLVDIAGFNVAILLFNDPETREHLLSCEDWIRWFEFINGKVSKLFLPSNLEEIVIAESSDVGRILKARNKRFHRKHDLILQKLGRRCQCFKGILHRRYRWTSEEYFDERKTIQAFVQDQQLDLAFRFTLACENALEDNIVQFWEQMPQTLKNCFYQNDLPYKVIYWVKLLLISEDSTYKNPAVNLREHVSRTLQSFKENPSLKSSFEKQHPREWKYHPEMIRKIEHVPGINRRWFRDPAAYHDRSCQVELSGSRTRTSQNGPSMTNNGRGKSHSSKWSFVFSMLTPNFGWPSKLLMDFAGRLRERNFASKHLMDLTKCVRSLFRERKFASKHLLDLTKCVRSLFRERNLTNLLFDIPSRIQSRWRNYDSIGLS